MNNRPKSKIRIGLIAPSAHSEVLRTLVLLLNPDAYQVRVFASTQNILVLSGEFKTDSWVELKTSNSEIKEKSLDDLDLIIFVTLNNHFRDALRIVNRVKSILIVHTGNYSIFHKSRIYSPNLWINLRRLYFKFIGESAQLNKFIYTVQGISFSSSLVQNYMSQQIKDEETLRKIVEPIPFSYFEEIPKLVNSSIKIIVPGSFDPRRKNYEILLEALHLGGFDNYPDVDFHFAGKILSSMESRRLKKKFEETRFTSTRFHFYPNTLIQSEYDLLLKNCHYLLLLPRPTYLNICVKEKYGYSTITGGINDMIRFRKPTILPQFYPIDPHLSFLTKRYDTAHDLSAALNHAITNQPFYVDSIDSKAFQNQYNFETRRQKLDEILTKFMEK